jgi:predicted metal-dependent hydrolase
MRVRKPSVEFSQTPARWAPNGEFAQQMNASSLWIPHLERFLNRVMAQAAAKLDGNNPQGAKLKADVRTFIRQEGHHTALHAAFNQILPREGYDIAAFESHFEAEFERLLKTKSFKFLCAYCEGFETLGPALATVWLDEIDDLVSDADPNVVMLWKWHLMEEYEHRMVCHDVARTFGVGYFQRVYGFLYQARQLQGFTKQVLEYLLGQDARGMTKAQEQAMRQRDKQVRRRMLRQILPHLIKAMMPFHNPERVRAAKNYEAFMAEIEASLALQE